MEEWKDGVGANEAEDSFSMESNEIEQSKVSIMRALVEVEDPSAKVPSFFSQSYVSFFFFFGFSPAPSRFLHHRLVCWLNYYYPSCFGAK
jgi:hypothetical protein